MATQLEQFDDLGVNVVKATKWMDYLGISSDDLIDNNRFLKVRDVFQFLNKYENADFLLTKLKKGYTQDIVQKVWEYTQKYSEKERILKEYESLSSEIDLIKDIPEASSKMMVLKEEQINRKVSLNNIEKELAVYEG